MEMETETEKGRQNYKLKSSRGEVSLSVVVCNCLVLPGKNCDCYLSLGLY